MLRLTPDFEILHLTCDFKTLHLMPARCQPDARQTPARLDFSKSGVGCNISKSGSGAITKANQHLLEGVLPSCWNAPVTNIYKEMDLSVGHNSMNQASLDPSSHSQRLTYVHLGPPHIPLKQKPCCLYRWPSTSMKEKPNCLYVWPSTSMKEQP